MSCAMGSSWRHIAAVLTLLVATGAASAQARAPAAHPADPLEGWNRGVYSFNDGLDTALIKPLATGYKAVVPELVRAGVSNFFGNFGDVWSAVNQLLQGKPVAAAQMTMRVATNTLFGIGGLFDVASEAGIERRSEDFGQTLGRWGLPAGLYLVWPLLGPSSLRDSAALPLDVGWSPSLAVRNDQAASNSLTALRLIDTRAGLLGASRVLDDVALDKYQFVRDAYLSRRRSLVYDGEPPELPAEADEPAAPAAPAAPASAPK